MQGAARTFRIFVSSTFSDLQEERNALQRRVFPRLRDLCTQHGCRFQAIDLRWGVREEAALDQQTMRICADEIDRCRRISPRPNFIVLLGDRYGWQPLPAEIPSDEFEEILGILADSPEKAFLDAWYKRDANAIPPVYCLQPRSGEFVDYQKWETVEKKLQRILRDAAAKLGPDSERLFKYESSATEQEIFSGAMKVEDAQEHVYGFFRKINGLPDDRSAEGYIDLDPGGKPDLEARKKLELLKAKLRNFIPGNIAVFEAAWEGNGITTIHLEELCEKVYQSLSTVILKEIGQLTAVDPLEKEISDHEEFGQDRAKNFTGRTEYLEKIAGYIKTGPNSPLALVGESGSGKSAVMGKAAEGARTVSLKPPETVVRFVGATPESSDCRVLLEGLCRQVSRTYGGDESSIPSDYKELTNEFPKRLALATPDKPLVIFLDALDQLSAANNARSLVWLPKELPANVKIVVSCTQGDCGTALQNKLAADNLVPLKPMPAAEGRKLLGLWFGAACRTLQPEQVNEVIRKFEGCGLPLYLKIAFEEARRWKSYSAPVDLSPDIPGIIRGLFNRLSSDAHHGAVIVSRSLAYLAAAKNGLSEDELLDVLALDPAVMEDFQERARHAPPEKKLPVIVWSRLFFDLEPYLSERRADGASLISFYHRQLGDAAAETYLAGEEKQKRHKLLADYFGAQPLFSEKENLKTPNLRKLSELPYQQTYGKLWDGVYETLTDFEFLEAKCTHIAVAAAGRGESAQKIYGGVYELLEDYRRALEYFPASDVRDS